MSAVRNIGLCGVGGQGILFLGQLLANAFMRRGLDVRVAEIHGMAQRGGSVLVELRYGTRVHAPASHGDYDILVALEYIEGLRQLHKLKRDGVLILNLDVIRPLAALLGEDVPALSQIYPILKQRVGKLAIGNFTKTATRVASPRATNVFVAGVLLSLGILPISVEDVEGALRVVSPPRFLEVNLRALHAGLAREEVEVR
ncbi:indolepyruvate oxidoreductase subunit beta [archaeon]|nr:indolepyruvate oxidoreductase subunit beta [archaeon]